MNLIIMIFLISLLILVHEFGHYIAARIFGVKVSKFGIGMPIGPTLYKTKKGDLEILIHAFLLGGYVSFPDDEDENKDKNKKDEEDSNEPTLPLDSPERLMNKPCWQRAIIISAGVIMNMLFAYVLVFFTAAVFQKLPSDKHEIFVSGFSEDSIISKDYKDTIKEGDKILKVNGVNMDAGYEFIFLVRNSKDKDGKIDKETADNKLREILKLNPNLKENEIIKDKVTVKLPSETPEKSLNVKPDISMLFGDFETGEVDLSENEIKLRDELTGKNTYVSNGTITTNELANALSDSYKPLSITVLRDNKELTFNNIKVPNEGVLGIMHSQNDVYDDTKTLKDIIIKSNHFVVENVKLVFYTLKLLVTGKVPVNELHGIIVVAKIGTDLIKYSGFIKALLWTAMISINLAVLNLLPIPALDGGHLLFIALEKIMGKKLNQDVVNKITNGFFIALLIFMVLVLFNDVWALIIGKF